MDHSPCRYAPGRPFPPYIFTPGGKHPHPEKNGGYHGDQKPGLTAPLDSTNQATHPDYLYSLDLFNHHYYWEAHVWLEALWNELGRKGDAADFLKALIKLCAARIKEEGNNHLSRARELLGKLPPNFLGLDVVSLLNTLEEGVCPRLLRIEEESLSLGGGCFWGVQHALSFLPGVLQTTCGYQGGHLATPSYEQVCRGDSGHAEVVLTRFIPSVLPPERLLEAFLIIHDPTEKDRQGPDVGSQYRSAVFCQNERQLARVIRFLEEAAPRFPRPLATQSGVNTEFYPAEEYHQDYLAKTPGGYCHIPSGVFRRIQQGNF